MYNWSLLGSNDNKTWTELHLIEKPKRFNTFEEKFFKVEDKKSYSMFKIIQNEPEPGCWFCMTISRLEFYGSIDDDKEVSNEEEVSIIGRIKS